MRLATLATLLSIVMSLSAGPSVSAGADNGQDPSELLKALRDRTRAQNGIYIDEPKIYDDGVLQQMLAAAEARLAAMQILDATGLAQRLGAITGASQRATSFGLSIQGPPIPGSTTTTTAPAGTRQVQTTSPQINPPSAPPPPLTTTLPSTFTVSASDILNEQMQLTYEIANLRLLLEGALSDRLIRDKSLKVVKPRTTVGFSIAVDPDARYCDAAAVVEVEIETDGGARHLGEPERPAITALLPREKTYNVASITETNVSIGAGIVTQVASVAGNWLWGRRNYYLVQDQDTVAVGFQPEDKHRVGFQWQFRPVLGRNYVKTGVKQTFVQLAFPIEQSADPLGRLYIRTYWRKFDRKRGILKDIIPNSLKVQKISPWEIRRYVVDLPPKAFDPTKLEDLGGGQMLVKLTGRFLPGTSVRVGSTILAQGAPNFMLEPEGIEFIAPISDLATKKVVLAARDGTETPLTITPDPNTAPLIKKVTTISLDEANTLVTVDISDADKYNPPLTLAVGSKVFGYMDSPLRREPGTLSAVMPTSLLIANRELRVKPLFAPPDFERSSSVGGFAVTSQMQRLVPLHVGKTSVTFLLYGTRLSDVSVLSPPGVVLRTLVQTGDPDMPRLLDLTLDQVKTVKQLVLQRRGERPMLLAVPPIDVKETKPADPTPRERVVVGADEVVVSGDGFDELSQISFQGKVVPFDKIEGGKAVRLKTLKALGATSAAATQSFDFVFPSRKVSMRLEIVNAKVETVPR